MRPHSDSVANAYLDYMSSVYYITLSPDLQKILYWAKYTGVHPITVPHSSFSGKRHSIEAVPEISIEYQFSKKEEMNRTILNDLTKLFRESHAQNQPILKNSDGSFKLNENLLSEYAFSDSEKTYGNNGNDWGTGIDEGNLTKISKSVNEENSVAEKYNTPKKNVDKIDNNFNQYSIEGMRASVNTSYVNSIDNDVLITNYLNRQRGTNV
jgi:hypothetical protein